MINDIPESRIADNAIKAWRLTGLLVGLLWFFIPGASFFVAIMEGNMHWVLLSLIALPFIILYLFTGFVLPKLRWQRWRYEVNDDAIDLLRGFVFKTRTVVPINRVQHVDTKQGPIYRKYGLSSVKISTAATTHEIPALDDETATDVRNKISKLVRQVKEDV